MRHFLLALSLLLLSIFKLQAIPVYDGPRHATDIIDNVQDIIDQISQIKNQVDQINKLGKQIGQMDDYLDRVGHAQKVIVRTEELITDDVRELLEEIDEYINGEGLTGSEEQENSELYGEINKEEHKRENQPDPEDQYSKHERVEKEFAAYKNTSQSISQKRLAIVAQLEALGNDLNSASTDQQVQKINSSINAHKLMLSALKDEEERQYRSFQAELRRNENALAKEQTRYQERKKDLDKQNRNRPQTYKLAKSSEILNMIEGN